MRTAVGPGRGSSTSARARVSGPPGCVERSAFMDSAIALGLCRIALLQARYLVDQYGFVPLIEHCDLGCHDGAIVLAGRSHVHGFDDGPNSVADAHRRFRMNGELEQREAHALNQGLKQHSLDEAEGQCGRHHTPRHDAAVGRVDERMLQHSGAGDEVDEIRLSHWPAKRLYFRADLQVLPGRAATALWAALVPEGSAT